MLPFSFCKNPTIRKHCRHVSICQKTLMNYNHQLTSVVEKKISNALPDKVSIIFDGWLVKYTHYVAIISFYQSPCNQSYETVLLSCSPRGNEASLNADEHYNYMSIVLCVYGKDMSSFDAVTGDHFAINRSMSKRIGPTFVGCHSHRFNLPFKDITDAHKELVAKAQTLLTKLRFQIPAAKLRRLIPLKANNPVIPAGALPTICAINWVNCFHSYNRSVLMKSSIFCR